MRRPGPAPARRPGDRNREAERRPPKQDGESSTMGRAARLAGWPEAGHAVATGRRNGGSLTPNPRRILSLLTGMRSKFVPRTSAASDNRWQIWALAWAWFSGREGSQDRGSGITWSSRIWWGCAGGAGAALSTACGLRGPSWFWSDLIHLRFRAMSLAESVNLEGPLGIMLLVRRSWLA